VAAGLVGRTRSIVERFLSAHAPLSGSVLVGVSGGQDSVCLLDALGSVCARTKLRLIVVHVNHQLRGRAAAQEEQFVESLATRYEVPFQAVSVEVGSYASRGRMGLEEAARAARYQAFAAVSSRTRASAVFVGHTRDDLAETLLINIIRGTTSHGLSSILPTQTIDTSLLGPPALPIETLQDPSITVLRPLLEIPRRQTAEYCRALGLLFQSDDSNQDPSFLRNRIRNSLVPLLKTYNPSIVVSLTRLARSTVDDDRELESITSRAWSDAADATPARVGFAWQRWTAFSPAIQRRLLRRATRELHVPDRWTFRSLELARTVLSGRPVRRHLDLGGGLRLATSRLGFTLSSPGGPSHPADAVEPKEQQGGR
jgi:tRNA(Ile)-lysidine synthase